MCGYASYGNRVMCCLEARELNLISKMKAIPTSLPKPPKELSPEELAIKAAKKALRKSLKAAKLKKKLAVHKRLDQNLKREDARLDLFAPEEPRSLTPQLSVSSLESSYSEASELSEPDL